MGFLEAGTDGAAGGASWTDRADKLTSDRGSWTGKLTSDFAAPVAGCSPIVFLSPSLYLFIYISLSLSLLPSLSLLLYICIYIYVCIYIYIGLSLSLTHFSFLVFLSLSLTLSLSLSLSLDFSLCLFLFRPVSLFLSLSLAISLSLARSLSDSPPRTFLQYISFSHTGSALAHFAHHDIWLSNGFGVVVSALPYVIWLRADFSLSRSSSTTDNSQHARLAPGPAPQRGVQEAGASWTDKIREALGAEQRYGGRAATQSLALPASHTLPGSASHSLALTVSPLVLP